MRLYSTLVAFTAVVFAWLAANLSMRALAKSAKAVGLFGFAALMLAANPAAAQSPNFNSYASNPTNTGGVGSRITFILGFNSGNRVITTLTITSALGVNYTCTPGTGDTGQQATCVGTYLTTASDVANGRAVERPTFRLNSLGSISTRQGSIITVPVAANIPPPVGSNFTAGAVAYNAGSASINLADHITYDPTDYSVSGSANGGSVSVNSAGIATYTPPVGFRGNDTFTFTGTNASATSTPATVTVPVGNPTLAISRTGSGQQGVTLSGVSITATGGQAPYSCASSVSSGALPAGVSLNSDCTLTGTPSVSGTFNFTVAVTDSSTGTGPFTQTSGPLSLTLTPAVPVVTSISPTAGPTGGGTTVVITGNYLLGASALTFGATPATGFTVNSTTQITATAPAGAAGAVDVRVTTAGGTSATSAADQYTYVPAPTVTSISPTAGPSTGGTSVIITGSNLSGATAVTFGATAATGFTVNSATQITATAPAGTGTVDVRVTTLGGTSATSAADQYTYIPAPTVTAISPTAGPASGGTAVTITGTNFTGLTAVTFGATPAIGFTFNSPTSITATAPAGTGTVDIRITTGGGTSSTSAADQFTYVAAPTVTAITPTAGPATGGTTVVITGANLSGATAVTFGATAATGYTVNSATQITATAPAGTGTVDVRVTTVGGTSATSGGDQFTYVAAPTVTAISPTAGPTTGGTTVTITGTNLSGATAVTFGATAATGFTVNSATQITATAPAGTGTVDVRVTTIGGTSATSAADQFTYVAAPTVSSITPTAGPTTGGTTVTITGMGFSGATAVTFGAMPASGFTVNSATQITATAPAGAAGTVDIRVTTIGGTSATSAADQFTYVAAPTVTAITPTAGPATGGTTVIITGAGFSGATAVTFGATAATGYTVNSATQITATAPAGTGTIDVRVTTIGGTSATSAADQFTYVAAPTVTAITPTAGPATGGTTVVITGANLSGATAVTFGATAATGFTVNSATQITATAPAGAGTVDVRVTTLGGTSATSAGDQFTYVAGPSVTSVSPDQGPQTGGTTVTLTGANFSGATAVTFGATAATGYTVNSATQITATAPAGTGTIDVRVTTIGGTSATSAADQFTYVAPPAAPATITPANGAITGDNTPAYAGTALAGSTVTVYVDGGSIGTTTATGGNWTLNQPTGLADGPHTVWSTATTIGGTSGQSNTSSFTVDTTAPNAPVVTAPANGSTINTAAAPVSGTAEAGSTVTVIVDGAVSGTATANGSGNWSFSTAALAQGSHTVRATATDTAGNTSPSSSTNTFTYSPLSIPAGALAGGQVGVDYTATITADGGVSPYNYAITAGALPSGLDLASNGSISGTPIASGTFNFTVTVTDGNSLTASQSFAITVAAPAPPTADPDVVTVVNTGGGSGPAAINLSGSVENAERIEIVDQPSNGSVTVNGFVVTYTPQPGFFGVVTFTYKAIGYANGSTPGAESAPATVTITIPDAAPVLAGGVLPDGTAAVAYSTTLSASGGTAPYTYLVTAGALPAGLTLASDGTLSGTPTAGGTFNFTVEATDSSTGTGPFVTSGAYTLTINAPAIVVTPATLPAAQTAVAYSQSFSASGGVGTYTYAVTAGALPAGLTLSPAGVLSGTPTAGGPFNFTVTATDSATGSGPFTGSQAYTLTVNAAAIVVTPTTIPNASRGFAYSASLSASGGTGSYAYTLSSGALPAGVTLSPTGVISGTPTVTGTFNFQVTATDQSTGAGPYSGTVNLSLTVNAASITVTPTTLPNVMAGFAYDRQLSAAGGSGTYTYAVTSGALPTGITLSTTGRISGVSYQVGTFNFTATATDSFGNTGSVPLTLQITARPDPSQDPDVRGLDAAQAEATRRLTETQIDNFSRRLEQLHAGGATRTVSMGLSLNSGVMQLEQDADLRTRLGGGRMFGQEGRTADPARTELNNRLWPAGADGRTVGGASDGVGFGETGGSMVNGGLNAGQSNGSSASAGGLRFWTAGAIQIGDRDADTNQAAFSVRTTGVSVGADIAVTPTLDLGVGGGFGEEQADVGAADSAVDTTTFVGVVYGSWRPADGVFLDAILGYGQLEFDLQRRATGDNSLVTGERDGSVVFGSIGLGFDRTVLETGRLSAYGRIESLNAELDAYTETGSPLWALSFDARDVESLQGVLGTRFVRSYAQRDTLWTPSIRLEYRHEFAEGGVQNLGYADWSGGPVYQIQSAGWERDELSLNLGLDVQTANGWTAGAELGGRFSADQTLGTIKLLFSRRF